MWFNCCGDQAPLGGGGPYARAPTWIPRYGADVRMAVALKRDPSMACFQSSICPSGTMTVLTEHVQKCFPHRRRGGPLGAESVGQNKETEVPRHAMNNKTIGVIGGGSEANWEGS